LSSGVFLYCEPGEKIPRREGLKKLAALVVKREKLKGRVNVVFCADQRVRYLNRQYRGLDRVTDVLSFSWGELDFAGEIFITNAQAARQAKRFNNSHFGELRRLIVHGLLHLCGYDHIKIKDRTIMRKKEDFYLFR
jgi:probable rRNA maturation factor